MAYKSKSIKNMVEEIESSKVYLPALQRKFVWDKPQIELLFDSIIRNFPIGTFLFWNLSREVANNYVFYEFLKEYDQRNPYNKRKMGSFLNPEITGVLDGQQRLSSMYIGLQGTHTEKAPYMRWSNEKAYTALFIAAGRNIISEGGIPLCPLDQNEFRLRGIPCFSSLVNSEIFRGKVFRILNYS